MSRQTKFIWAIIIFLAYGAIAIYSGWLPGSARDTEAALDRAAQSRIQALNKGTKGQDIASGDLDKVTVEMDGQLARISGTLPSNSARDIVISEILSAKGTGGIVSGGVTVVRADGLKVVEPTPDTPFLWTATSDGKNVTISGMVPDEISRTRIVDHARKKFASSNVTVIDRMTVTRGTPAGDWLGAVSTSIDALAHIDRGKVTGNDLAFSISGMTRTPETKTEAEVLMAELPAGYTGSATVELGPIERPYRWQANFDGQGPVILTGFAPDEDTRSRIVAHAEEKFPQGVIDQLKIAPGVPVTDNGADIWEAHATASLSALSGLVSGQVRAVDTTFTLTGIANNAEAITATDQIKAGVASDAFVFVSDLTVEAGEQIEDATKCQTLFNEATAQTSIRFANGRADLLPASRVVLDRLALAVKQCSAFNIQVEGHTDSVGSATLNKALSEARAQSVVEYLTDKGVLADQVKAQGYGESRPVADNSTPQGRARNRRIDFTIQQ